MSQAPSGEMTGLPTRAMRCRSSRVIARLAGVSERVVMEARLTARRIEPRPLTTGRVLVMKGEAALVKVGMGRD